MICDYASPTFSAESPKVTSSGKEKQLFNSLGLAQQSNDAKSEGTLCIEKSSSITKDEQSPIETILRQPDNQLDGPIFSTIDASLSSTLKRKSVFTSNTQHSSNRKQSKIDKTLNTVGQ